MPANNEPTKLEEKQRLKIADLELQLAEATETLRAIREGEVDAVIVSGTQGEQIFSLVGADSIYRLIVETMKEAAFTVTPEGDILFCNAQFGQFIQRPMEQVVGHPLREFVAEHDRGAASALLTTAQQQSVKQRMVFQTVGGAPVPAHVSANVLSQPDGLSICIVATDLTELENSTELIQQLRRQQEALRDSDERFRLAANTTHTMVYDIDVRTRRLNAMQGLSSLLGYGEAEAELSLEWWERQIHPDDLNRCRASFQQMLASPCEQAIEYRVRHKDGRTLHVEGRASPVRDGNGQVVRIVGTVFDITERKLAEYDLKRSVQELEFFNKAMVGRELRMIELKKEIDALCRKFGQPLRYCYDTPPANFVKPPAPAT